MPLIPKSGPRDQGREIDEKTIRYAAGEDPAKRDQILDGAASVFFNNGFDAASMNDVCKAACVSKGTIYVYFADKVDLFEALVARERDRVFADIEARLDSDVPLEQRLTEYGVRLAEVMCSDRVIQAQRIVAGAVEKMPEMGAKFYETGAKRSHILLIKTFEREVADGSLRMSDPVLAANQFSELATAGLWRKRLFNKTQNVPSAEEIATTVASAVHVFLAAYGADKD